MFNYSILCISKRKCFFLYNCFDDSTQWFSVTHKSINSFQNNSFTQNKQWCSITYDMSHVLKSTIIRGPPFIVVCYLTGHHLDGTLGFTVIIWYGIPWKTWMYKLHIPTKLAGFDFTYDMWHGFLCGWNFDNLMIDLHESSSWPLQRYNKPRNV